ncbi:hypothetical protein CXF85_16705 [Colwellia sp. 75C3]|uniref:substrate-binding periplasmic protein n=1 Tax=Colwellia sp. 75C3 TaxID=888425 RepID=UPI000C33B259|nr:ABC transporter substrate-binding protein [Colwellia sp. 75C3]PKG81849.1 hypothetical protein CXF85_16705 [Colwellia sp. 75C3]
MKRTSKIRCFIYVLLIFSISATAKEPIKDIHYFGSKNKYSVELLQHVLSYNSKKNYQLVPFTEKIPKDRAFAYMEQDELFDVIFAGATTYRLENHLAIEFPLLKGLNGWRIPMVNTKNKDIFKSLTTLDDFKKLTPGLFHLWSDTEIMQRNNIYVETGSSFNGLWLMLDKNRFDYFPRSILQVFNEIKNYPTLNIMIEKSSMIHYPTAYYFYVKKGNNDLASDIKSGLEKALIDGSFNKLFTTYYGHLINKVKKQNRKVFSLDNPLVPASTPLMRKELWIDLSSNIIN